MSILWFSDSSGAAGAGGGCSVTAEEVNDLESRVQAALQQFLNTNLMEETEEDLKSNDKDKDSKEDSSKEKEEPPSSNVETSVTKDKKENCHNESEKDQS